MTKIKPVSCVLKSLRLPGKWFIPSLNILPISHKLVLHYLFKILTIPKTVFSLTCQLVLGFESAVGKPLEADLYLELL